MSAIVLNFYGFLNGADKIIVIVRRFLSGRATEKQRYCDNAAVFLFLFSCITVFDPEVIKLRSIFAHCIKSDNDSRKSSGNLA